MQPSSNSLATIAAVVQKRTLVDIKSRPTGRTEPCTLMSHQSTSIDSLVYSHTYGCHAHCTWWQNVNVIEGAERITNFYIFCVTTTL